MKVEVGPETSVFRSWGGLRRIDAEGNRIDYTVPAPTFPVETDVFVEPDGHPFQNGFHANGVNGIGVNTKLLTDSRT